jgi:RNA polymerase sigma factor (TIGR02999 family)
MNEVTRILSAIESGDPSAAADLLPLVYDELRKLAAVRLAAEKPGQTIQATALVHEAYLQLVGNDKQQHWNGRSHFFGAAAEAMRRILVDRARHKLCGRAGGQFCRIELSQVEPEVKGPGLDLLELDEALERLTQHDSRAAEVVKLRYFAGMTVPEVAAALSISLATAENDWAYAKSWLRLRLSATGDSL